MDSDSLIVGEIRVIRSGVNVPLLEITDFSPVPFPGKSLRNAFIISFVLVHVSSLPKSHCPPHSSLSCLALMLVQDPSRLYTDCQHEHQ